MCVLGSSLLGVVVLLFVFMVVFFNLCVDCTFVFRALYLVEVEGQCAGGNREYEQAPNFCYLDDNDIANKVNGIHDSAPSTAEIADNAWDKTSTESTSRNMQKKPRAA